MTEVRNQTELLAAITALESEIVVVETISMARQATIRYAVQIRGEGGVSLLWTGAAANRRDLFIITATGDLTLDSLVLDAEGRDGTFVQINGGKLTMNSGVVMQNVRSTTANGAVHVGDLAESYGGTFIMNGGLITAIDTSDAVTNFGGTVIMNNDAAISDNMAAGITMSRPIFGGERPALTMTGQSRVSGNVSKQTGGAGIIMDSDVIMGVAPGDAPSVTGNRSPYDAGGWYITEYTVLTMRYNARIENNHADLSAGGLLAEYLSTVSLHENATIQNNTCTQNGGGAMLSGRSTATLDGNARISDNAAEGSGGGMYVRGRASLTVLGTASVYGNTAKDGAGIFLNGATAAIGAEGSSPTVYRNTATGVGGGIYISQGSDLHLSGHVRVYDNTAERGKGIYKDGMLGVAESTQVTDGLYFDNPPDLLAAAAMRQNEPYNGSTVTKEENRLVLNLTPSAPGEAFLEPSGGVAIIEKPLAADARIVLELSRYVSPQNAPVKIAESALAEAKLGELDRAAWVIPQEFIPGHVVNLNGDSNEVWIDRKVHNITYHELNGAENDNPDTFTMADLPLVLVAPGQRPGYTFVGWQDLRGVFVDGIPVGTYTDVDFVAIWQEMILSFDENGAPACNMPENMPVRQGDAIIVPWFTPSRKGCCFVCWSTSPTGTGTIYVPGNTVPISDRSVTLYARWMPSSGCCCEKCRRRYMCEMVDWPQE